MSPTPRPQIGRNSYNKGWLVFLATRWGTKEGGVNAFNMDIVRALASHLPERVACVVPDATTQEKHDATSVGVRLVSLSGRDFADANEIFETLLRASIAPVDWWIGHDLITGPLAVDLKHHVGRSAVLFHTSPIDYQSVKSSAGRAQRKRRDQQRLAGGADCVFAVGPLLTRATEDLFDGDTRSVMQLLPGRADIGQVQPHHRLNVLVLGRLDPEDDAVKQGRLAIAAFGTAVRTADSVSSASPLAHARLTILGASEQHHSEIQQLAAERAERQIVVLPLPYETCREEVLRHMHEASIVLMPSWHEGFGLAGWEALSAGIPLVLGKNSGLYEFLHDQKLTHLVHGVDIRGPSKKDQKFSKEDLEQLSRKIVHVASDLSTEWAKAAELRKKLLPFTWDRTAREFLDGLYGNHQHLVEIISPPRYQIDDGAWGGLPAEPLDLIRPAAASRFAEFKGSDEKCCVILGRHGRDLSVFAARCLADLDTGRGSVCRLECKEFLPTDVYKRRILISLGLRSAYYRERSRSAEGWNASKELETFVKVVSDSGRRSAILFDHPERLRDSALRFFCTLSEKVDNLRLLFASTNPPEHLCRGSVFRCELTEPTRDSLLAAVRQQLERHGIEDCTAEEVVNAIPGSGLTGIVMAVGLLARQRNVQTLARRWQTNELRGLLEEVISVVSEDRQLEDLAAACAVLRTRRPFDLLRKLYKGQDLKRHLHQLVSLGVLMEAHCGSGYSMSTTIREFLLSRLFGIRGCRSPAQKRKTDWRRWHRICGDYYAKAARHSDEGFVSLTAMSFYHRVAGSNWEMFCSDLKSLRPRILRTWDFELLRDLIEIPKEFARGRARSKRLNFEITYTEALLARLESLPGRFVKLLRKAKKYATDWTQEVILEFEFGIAEAMKRQYLPALRRFESARGIEYQNQSAGPSRFLLKIENRIAQTLISLGRYDEAEKQLKRVGEQLRVARDWHEYAVYYRHIATLNLVEAASLKGAGAFLEFLTQRLNTARRAAQRCLEISDGSYPDARDVGRDETGVGLARLKLAQVDWYAEEYASALLHLEPAIGLLSGFPNNRWWRMCCHDLKARCLAKLKRIDEAYSELSQAERILEDSSYEDIVRICELRRTAGLIELAAGRPGAAIRDLHKSLEFAKDPRTYVPSIYLDHLSDLLLALAADRRFEEMLRYASVAQRVREGIISFPINIPFDPLFAAPSATM